jgi:beta-glucanase (GH16 family)
MKAIKALVLIAIISVLTGCSAFRSSIRELADFPDTAATRDGLIWKLVWADEFDYEGLPDPLKWDYEVGYVRNNELQYYTKSRLENARVEDGLLIIETRKETSQKIFFTSASLVTYNTASWRYGRIEVRAKLPTGIGMWPAIFMLGKNIEVVGWPACGEIDIMESVGFEPDMIYGNIHTQAYNWVSGTNKGAKINIPLTVESFHIYAIEWSEEEINFFVDAEKYFTFENDGKGWETWPFAEEFYLIINAAFGGIWGGKHGADDSILPQRFYIDYVRVYKRNQVEN